MTVPMAVREKYDRVLNAYRTAAATTRAARAGQPGSAFETMVDSYQRLNEFFKYFIDHVSGAGQSNTHLEVRTWICGLRQNIAFFFGATRTD